MPYQYQHLPSLQDDGDIYIRLLELHYNPRSGPITGRLFSTRLSLAPKFRAVSYCWGPSTRRGTIHITDSAPPRDLDNDNTLEIPTALIPLLQRLRGRYRREERTMWIDSICLNQRDGMEKTIHVPRMRDIYDKAQYTMSWLGSETKGTKEAFAYATELFGMFRRVMAAQGLVKLTEEEEKEKSVGVKVRLGMPALETMLQLLERPYFERTWVVQELIVSRTVFLLCGNATIGWGTLVGAFMYLCQTQAWLFEFYSGLRIHYLLELRFSELDWETARDVPWSRTLIRHRACASGDSRDKVFAYYGLRCQNALKELGITPNYLISTKELYTTLAARALMKGQVIILHVPRLVHEQAQDTDSTLEDLSLASWVPDWRWTEQTPTSMVDIEGYFAQTPTPDADYYATPNSVFTAEFNTPVWHTSGPLTTSPIPLPKLLRLRGLHVATVTRLTRRRWEHFHIGSGPQTLTDQARLLQYTRQQVHEWEAVFRPASSTTIYAPTGESATHAMFETFMAGTTRFPEADKRAAVKAFARRQNFLRLWHTFHLNEYLVLYIVLLWIEHVFRRFGYNNPEMAFRTMVEHMGNRRGAQMVGAGW